MSMEQSTSITSPGIKIVTAWAAVGITSWTEAAAFAAFIYTCALLAELIWKNIARPFCEARGWIERKRRRHDDR